MPKMRFGGEVLRVRAAPAADAPARDESVLEIAKVQLPHGKRDRCASRP